jgi:spoIIIJ-associated protein
MRDQVFAGETIDEALAAAARTLGLPREKLRYVVLDPGKPGGRGLSPTPARIAILHDDPQAAARAAAAPAVEEEAPPTAPVPLLMGLLQALERALDEPLGAEVREDEEEGLVVRIDGPARRWLLEEDGEPLAALDHLLRRILQAQGHTARLTLWCEGWRERRDAALRERVLALARAVREDGQPRRMEPLNSYERRIVHMAVAELGGGLTTFSEGEGHERFVTIAPGPRPPQS